MKVGVIGAGPAGLTAAYKLAEQGHEVELYEASDSVGGMAKTINLWGQRVDLGPHRFFSNDRRINEFWLKFAGLDYRMVKRLTRIRYKDRFFMYPLEIRDVFSNLTPLEIMQIGMSYSKEKIIPSFKDTDTFESWVTNRFGKRLFQIFFKSYSEKLWGITCDRLDADFASQRIKKLSVSEVVKSFFSQSEKSKHMTLVDQFAYPVGGSGMVYERMAEQFEALGGTLMLNAPVRRLIMKDGRAAGVELASGAIRPADEIISTMPLTSMVKGLPDIPDVVADACDHMKFRSTLLVYIQMKGNGYFPDNWLYVHSPNLQTGRITNFRNWVPQINADRPETILALEYWCNKDDETWQLSDETLVNIAMEDLRKSKLVPVDDVLGGSVVRIPRCYPVYETGYKKYVTIVSEYLQQIPGLSVIGRYGSFKYNNQDHSILMGLLAADIIGNCKDNRASLWDVNTDYDTYHEQARITETGLQATV